MKVSAKEYQEFTAAEKLLKEAFREYNAEMDNIKGRLEAASRLYHFEIPPETYGEESAN